MGFDLEPAALVAELDAMRAARGLSYQQVADACGVSKATIYRTLTGATEPTMQLLQAIAAAVKYKPQEQPLAPTDLTKDGYIAYLQEALARKDETNERRVQQLHAHYNMLLRQGERRNRWLTWALIASLVILIGWLIIDVTHPTVGWIRRDVSLSTAVASALQRVETVVL